MDSKRIQDVEPIWNALSKVLRLRGVSFKRTDINDYDVGLIAQEVKPVIGEAVKVRNDELVVEYGNLVGVLVEAIRELNGQVQAMRVELDDCRRHQATTGDPQTTSM